MWQTLFIQLIYVYTLNSYKYIYIELTSGAYTIWAYSLTVKLGCMYHLSCSRNWDLWFHTIYFDIKFEKKNDDASNMIVSNSYDPYVIYELNSSKMQKNLALIPTEACLPNLNIWLHVASRSNLNETLFISCITLEMILLTKLH